VPGSEDVGFVVDKVALGQVFLRVLWFSSVVSLFHHCPIPLHEVCDSSNQVAHYHKLGPKLGASSLTQHLAGREERCII
jgi:hypothetical protein